LTSLGRVGAIAPALLHIGRVRRTKIPAALQNCTTVQLAAKNQNIS
jgi:hypothetical protein